MHGRKTYLTITSAVLLLSSCSIQQEDYSIMKENKSTKHILENEFHPGLLPYHLRQPETEQIKKEIMPLRTKLRANYVQTNCTYYNTLPKKNL